jgi:hypothetical protein
MGYSGALVKFVAQHWTRRDVRALNEILSTLFFVFVLAARDLRRGRHPRAVRRPRVPPGA